MSIGVNGASIALSVWSLSVRLSHKLCVLSVERRKRASNLHPSRVNVQAVWSEPAGPVSANATYFLSDDHWIHRNHFCYNRASATPGYPYVVTEEQLDDNGTLRGEMAIGQDAGDKPTSDVQIPVSHSPHTGR